MLPAASTTLDADTLYRRHAATVFHWACAMGAGPESARDIVQEVFLRLVRSAATFDDSGPAIAWLRRATASVTIDRWRSSSAAAARDRSHVAPGEARLSSAIDRADERDRIRRAMTGLSEMQHLVLCAKTADAMTFAQIAQELDISIPTAKTHYLRALQHLRDALGGES